MGEKIPEFLKIKFKKWMEDITNIKAEILRAIPLTKESVTAVGLQVFGYARQQFISQLRLIKVF